MKYVILLVLAFVSFVASRLILALASPNDPEGTNLLITTVVAIAVFVPLLLGCRLISRKR